MEMILTLKYSLRNRKLAKIMDLISLQDNTYIILLLIVSLVTQVIRFLHYTAPAYTPPSLVTPKHSTITVAKGDDVILACVSNGYPRPVYRWEQQGVTLEDTANDEFIKVINIDQSQRFICSAFNNAGSTTATYDVVVEGKYLYIEIYVRLDTLLYNVHRNKSPKLSNHILKISIPTEIYPK